MKTTKRVLLSIILLQAVCQPVSAISFDSNALLKSAQSHPYITAGIVAGTALGTYYRENIKHGFNKVVNTIKTHPIKSIALTSFAGLLSLYVYARAYPNETLTQIMLSDYIPENVKLTIFRGMQECPRNSFIEYCKENSNIEDSLKMNKLVSTFWNRISDWDHPNISNRFHSTFTRLMIHIMNQTNS